MKTAHTMLDKIWAQHVIVPRPGGEDLLLVDLNLLHEGGTFLAFDQLRAEGRKVRKPRQNLAITDHYLPSVNRAAGVPGIANPEIRNVVAWLDQNAREFGIEHIGMHDPRQGITHVIAPELGLAQPGLLITCCDSHTATQGAMGALAVPIGQSSQLRHVLATQTLWDGARRHAPRLRDRRDPERAPAQRSRRCWRHARAPAGDRGVRGGVCGENALAGAKDVTDARRADPPRHLR